MKSIRFQIGSLLGSGLVLALFSATAHGADRDKEKEDHVAKLFEGIRAEAGLPPLKRIRHRGDLEQSICTSALTGETPARGSAFYTTSDPESVSPELEKIASSKRRLAYARFSVAVWRVKDPRGEAVAYRIGVGLYESALAEFVDCHFTDDVYYCGRWKKSIMRPCRGK
jgi:hypothetical protein